MESLHKHVWRADLSKAELEALLYITDLKLKASIKEQMKAHTKELEKLKKKRDAWFYVPAHDDEGDIRGDICMKVMERWGHEKMVEEMTGKKPDEGVRR
ncbi:hypothetical protein BAUCODRAFT_140924 [Baudoinia panamericana UAMH 10762]|uniref:WHIM2 domain-containing protein n=1 Tax=Baudoinia panamericana (strain UAMH 10762) TaxID=717646 RepID=M2MDK3_BAUPA|nr:uncharacterized protein BAUCODRAFT_140924 [Baudoinia panamericana UAMH 10762]EMC94621.1 hypothetical protein BAUCODRAFT_140924 [Baudoinia panamericana UAMH 10762]